MGMSYLLIERMGGQTYVEKPVLPDEVFSNVFFSELDTGVEGRMFLGELWVTAGDVDRFTISSGKPAEFPSRTPAVDITGLRFSSADVF